MIWGGVFSLFGGAFLLSIVWGGYPSREFLKNIGVFVLPYPLMAGLLSAGASIAVLRRRWDWRLFVAALFGVTGVAMFVIGLKIGVTQIAQ